MPHHIASLSSRRRRQLPLLCPAIRPTPTATLSSLHRSPRRVNVRVGDDCARLAASPPPGASGAVGWPPVLWSTLDDDDFIEQEGTCALVACTVCVEAVHRIEYQKLHGTVGGAFGFPSRLGMRNLFIDCAAGGIWVWGQGAYVGEVLIKIQEMGGLVALTNSYALTLEKHVLPLRSWEEHWWGHYGGHGLSPERVAQLLWKGPCIGSLWVYTSHGCGRNDYIRRVIEGQFPAHRVGWHAVVCYGYRFRGGRMHVLVLDNHTPRGPRRWIHVEEFDRMYALTSLRAPTSGREGQPM